MPSFWPREGKGADHGKYRRMHHHLACPRHRRRDRQAACSRIPIGSRFFDGFPDARSMLARQSEADIVVAGLQRPWAELFPLDKMPTFAIGAVGRNIAMPMRAGDFRKTAPFKGDAELSPLGT